MCHLWTCNINGSTKQISARAKVTPPPWIFNINNYKILLKWMPTNLLWEGIGYAKLSSIQVGRLSLLLWITRLSDLGYEVQTSTFIITRCAEHPTDYLVSQIIWTGVATVLQKNMLASSNLWTQQQIIAVVESNWQCIAWVQAWGLFHGWMQKECPPPTLVNM